VSRAQQPYSYSFNERHGFGTNEIYYLHQDKKGRMWIGCNDGLYRYDGISFRQYTHPEQSGRSISHIREDSHGSIWCQNFTGQIFCVRNDSMLLVFDASTRMANFPVFDVNSKGVLYIGGQNELLVRENDGSTHSVKLPSASKNIVRAVGCMPDGDVIAISDKVYRYRAGKLSTITATNDTNAFARILHSLGNFEHYGGRTLFLCQVVRAKEYILAEIKEDSVVILSKLPEALTQGRLFNINFLDKNEIWFNTHNGTLRLGSDLRPRYSRPLLEGSNVSDIIKDNEGNYWLATLESGIHIVPEVELVQYTKTNSGLADNNVTSLYLKGNEMLLGYFNGEVSVLKEGNFQTLRFDPNYKYATVQKIERSPLTGTMFISHNYLSTIDGARIATLNSVEYVRDMCFLRGGNILYANGGAAGTLHMTGDVLDSVVALREIGSRCVCYDEQNGERWVGFNDGVHYFDDQDIARVLLYNGRKVFANCISYSGGIVWIGTISEGLLLVKDRKVIKHYSARNGMRGRSVRRIYLSGEEVWLATEKGINIIDRRTDRISHIDEYDGFPAMEINDLAIRNDSVFLVGTRGLFQFPARLRQASERTPGIFIDKVPHNRNKLTVFFHTDGLGEKNKYTYYYQLVPYESTWQSADRSTASISYSSLPPGDYVFQVKAQNQDGVYSTKMASFKISISKPFWQQWWFYVLIVFATVLLVSFLFSNRIRAIKQKAKLEQLIRSSQLTALKAQMNPHFVFNALNSIQDLMLKKDVRASSIYLGRFSELMRKVLDASDKDKVSLLEEIDILRLYLELEKLRFGEAFTYSIAVAPDIDVADIHIPSMVIQPFVENAIKHGLLHKEGEKKVQISFVMGDNSIECTITDNGVGRKASADIKLRSKRPHNGFAIKATEKRLDLLNDYHKEKIGLQIIDLELGGQALGTTVKIVLPLDRSDL
jgi:ligand-binding sensor domain-containing protein